MLYMLSILRPAMGSVAELTRSHDCTVRPIDVLELRHQEDCTVNVEVLAYCKETLTKCGVALSEMIGLPFTREEVEVRQPLDFALSTQPSLQLRVSLPVQMFRKVFARREPVQRRLRWQ